jgi:hypothetical protein
MTKIEPLLVAQKHNHVSLICLIVSVLVLALVCLTSMQVTGSWMTKIEALLRRLLLMRASDPSAKALVFSQYPDALALISKALNVVQVGGR